MIRFQKRIKEYDIIPKYYGVSWFAPAYGNYVCYPIGFNRVFSFLRKTRFWLKQGSYDKEVVKAFHQGFEMGVRSVEDRQTT